MHGQDIKVGQKVNVGQWADGKYAGVLPATVTEIAEGCDLRTQGHVWVSFDNHPRVAGYVQAALVYPRHK